MSQWGPKSAGIVGAIGRLSCGKQRERMARIACLATPGGPGLAVCADGRRGAFGARPRTELGGAIEAHHGEVFSAGQVVDFECEARARLTLVCWASELERGQMSTEGRGPEGRTASEEGRLRRSMQGVLGDRGGENGAHKGVRADRQRWRRVGA